MFALHHNMYAPRCGACGHTAFTFLENRDQQHQNVAIHDLRYLKETKDYIEPTTVAQERCKLQRTRTRGKHRR